MIRISIVELALVAAPFLLYFLYRAMVGARQAETGEAVDETPYQIMFFSGSAAALAALVLIVLFGHNDDGAATSRDEVYVPAHAVDGRVEPGYFISREEAIARGLVEAGPRYADDDPDQPESGEDDDAGETPSSGAP